MVAGILRHLGQAVCKAVLAAVVIAAAAHCLRLDADEASKGDDATAFAEYPMLRATEAPEVKEAISDNPVKASLWERNPWEATAPGPWWRWDEVGGPKATAVPHAAIGDAASYMEEWDFEATMRGSAPSVLPEAAGLEH